MVEGAFGWADVPFGKVPSLTNGPHKSCSQHFFLLTLQGKGWEDAGFTREEGLAGRSGAPQKGLGVVLCRRGGVAWAYPAISHGAAWARRPVVKAARDERVGAAMGSSPSHLDEG
jgi:hypothetical protein